MEKKFAPCRVGYFAPYKVLYPVPGIRQIFASGIRNPRNSAQEIRRNPETRNPETCTGNPGSTTWNSDNPRLSWIYLTLSEELKNVFVNAYTPYFSRSTPLPLFNIAVPILGNLCLLDTPNISENG